MVVNEQEFEDMLGQLITTEKDTLRMLNEQVKDMSNNKQILYLTHLKDNLLKDEVDELLENHFRDKFENNDLLPNIYHIGKSKLRPYDDLDPTHDTYQVYARNENIDFFEKKKVSLLKLIEYIGTLSEQIKEAEEDVLKNNFNILVNMPYSIVNNHISSVDNTSITVNNHTSNTTINNHAANTFIHNYQKENKINTNVDDQSRNIKDDIAVVNPSSQVHEDELTFKWLKDEKSLRYLHELLLAKKFIASTDFDHFKLAFSGNSKPVEPLIWLIKHYGENISPNKATLFYLLIGLSPEFIDISSLYRNTFTPMIHNMFVDFEGKKFDNLKQSKNGFKNRIKKIQEIKYNKPTRIQSVYSDLDEILISLYQTLPENR